MTYLIPDVSRSPAIKALMVVIAFGTFMSISAQQKHFLINSPGNPLKNFVTPLHSESHPFFIDIDGDGDLDCFSGEFGNSKASKIYYYRNEGTNKSPRFKQMTGAGNPLDKVAANRLSIPYFVDIDGNGTYDCFVGDGVTGALIYYKNIGTATKPKFEKQSAAFNPLSMVKFWALGVANPAFADIDGDGDFDCLIVDEQARENYFKNIGTATEPVFVHVQGSEDPFHTLTPNNTMHNASFEDWNQDGLVDLFINTDYYKNIGTKTNPVFALSKAEGPVFQNKSSNKYTFTPLRWINLNQDKNVEVVQGSTSGTFIYQSVSHYDDQEASLTTSITVFPNPSKDEFILKNIPSSSTTTVIRITDLQGKLLTTQTFNNNIWRFGIQLRTGTYMIEVVQHNKVIYSQKIVKEQ